LLVDNDHPKATSRGKERRCGSGWPGTKHRDIGVEGFLQAVTLARPECDLRLELGLFRFGGGFRVPLRTLRTWRRRCGTSGLARDRNLRRALTLRLAREACTDQFAPTSGSVGGSPRRARELTKRRLPSSVALFPVAQVSNSSSSGGGNPEPQPAHTGLRARVFHVL
jgi:hypothetical protein